SSERAFSWADQARDLSAWLGNDLQRDAFDSICRLHDSVLKADDAAMLEAYRHLQTSDHFYYMATKNGPDAEVHQYFSPYGSPYEAFMNFMNIITDLEIRARRASGQHSSELVTSEQSPNFDCNGDQENDQKDGNENLSAIKFHNIYSV